jgi:hypothetical protein
MRKVVRFSLIFAFILPMLSYSEKPSSAETRRFVDNGDGTVTDMKLGIMWQKGDNGDEVTFDQAKRYCTSLRLGGRDDWRLPNPEQWDAAVVAELKMPLHARLPYARSDLYWSSDPTVLLPFNYRIAYGTVILGPYPAEKGQRAFVRAVRSTRGR